MKFFSVKLDRSASHVLLQKDGHQEKVLCSQAYEFRKNVHDEKLGNLVSEKNGTT